jgi:hypothetical protein
MSLLLGVAKSMYDVHELQSNIAQTRYRGNPPICSKVETGFHKPASSGTLVKKENKLMLRRIMSVVHFLTFEFLHNKP